MANIEELKKKLERKLNAVFKSRDLNYLNDKVVIKYGKNGTYLDFVFYRMRPEDTMFKEKIGKVDCVEVYLNIKGEDIDSYTHECYYTNNITDNINGVISGTLDLIELYSYMEVY